MQSNDIIDAYCTSCEDTTKHKVMAPSSGSCWCLVCDMEQILA